VLVAVSMLVFGITMLLPGNVAYLILGPFAPPEQVRALELKLHLTDPVWQQYLRWAGAFLSGDLGESTLMNRPVAPLLMEALSRSLVLTSVSFVLIAVIGIGLGVVAALRHGRPLDHTVSIATYLGIAVPEFFWAIVVIVVFAAWLGWLPASGYEPLSSGVAVWAKHLIAPVITLVFGHLAHVSRLTRSSMIEVMQSPYVTAARAKGLPERVVVLHHALRNALLPSITVLALDFGRLMGGIVVVETIFAYPGLGRLVVFSIQNRDIPTLQAAILVVAAIYAFANLVADLLYAVLNPRIRFGRDAA
jgi:peptide/nickel transport system permease protein